MKNIVIIGAGQLGSRHLQGLFNIKTKFNVYVVDPSDMSLTTAKKRFEEVSDFKMLHQIEFLNDMDVIPNEIDLAIIATNSDVRFIVLENLLQKKIVKNLILEKVLFQKLDEYEQTRILLKAHNVDTFVNCPRRVMPTYQRLKEVFSQEDSFSLYVIGGLPWNISSNTIHFLDLCDFFGSGKLEHIKLNITDLIESKRVGYKNFSGVVEAIFDRCNCKLESLDDYDYEYKKVIIESENIKLEIIEEIGVINILKNENDVDIPDKMDFMFQSQLTGNVANDIFENSRCNLTTYATSESIHKVMIKEFLLEFSNILNIDSLDKCPIT